MTNYYNNHIQNHIQDELFAASKSIKIAMAWFTNNRLFQIVLLKLQTGVDVEIIINDDEINKGDNKLDFDSFVKNGGRLHLVNDGQLMHLKQCIIDENVLLTGSYNWTYKAEEQLAENLIVIKDEESVIAAAISAHNKLAKKYETVVITTKEINETNAVQEVIPSDQSNAEQSGSSAAVAVVTQVEDPKELLVKAVENFKNKLNKLFSEGGVEENADRYVINRVVRKIAESLDENKKFEEPKTFISVLKEEFRNNNVTPSIAELPWEKYIKEGNLGKVYVTRVSSVHRKKMGRILWDVYPENNEHLYQQIGILEIGFSSTNGIVATRHIKDFFHEKKSKKFKFKRLDYAQNPELLLKDQEPIPVIVCEDEDGQEFCLAAEDMTGTIRWPKHWSFIEKIDKEHFYGCWLNRENKLVPWKEDGMTKTILEDSLSWKELEDLSFFYDRVGRRMGLKEFELKKTESANPQKLHPMYIEATSIPYDFYREDDGVRLQLRDSFFMECAQLRMQYSVDADFLSAVFQKYKDKTMCALLKPYHRFYRNIHGKLFFPTTYFDFPNLKGQEIQRYYIGLSVAEKSKVQ